MDMRNTESPTAGDMPHSADMARRVMPVLGVLSRRFAAERPLENLRISADLHLLPSTVPLLLAYRDAGAQVAVCGSNPMSTDTEIARWLGRQPGIHVVAEIAENNSEKHRNLRALLDQRPDLIIDEAGALLGLLHAERPQQVPDIRGACVHTLAGVKALRSFAARGRLTFPVMAVDGSPLKTVFDNRQGTGMSSLHALISLTNTSLAGSCLVVAGYGNVGRGIAERARHLGAEVVITEADPLRAMEATMAGHRVLPMAKAVLIADVVMTATGSIGVVSAVHLSGLRDNVILANAGHGSVEIDTDALAADSVATEEILPMVTQYTAADGRRRLLLANGRAINTSAGSGHASTAMDFSFAAQALAVVQLGTSPHLAAALHELSDAIQQEVATLAARERGIIYDDFTPEHHSYSSYLPGEPEAAENY